MKLYLILFFYLVSNLSLAQEKTNIKVIVPNKDDEVYIVGNQKDLGDWNPDKVKMFKVSDYVRMVSIPFYFPAEFMFTKGSWASEGIIYELDYNPNIYLENYVDERVYKIKGWKNEMLQGQHVTTFKNDPFDSKILRDERKMKVFTPDNYSIEKRYPVIYVLDEGHNFKTAAGILDIWNKSGYKNIPDCILVGVPFTATELSNLGKENKQSELLQDYFIYDIIPFIEANYSTSGFNILAGKYTEADFSHKLMLKNNTPLSAVVSMEPLNNIDYTYRLKRFFDTYQENHFYYFLANASDENNSKEFDLFFREELKNEKIKIDQKKYELYGENPFVQSFHDGLTHVFQDYRNLKDYEDFRDFALNYRRNIMDIYRMEANIQIGDIDYFLNDILERKDIEMYNYLLNYIQTNGLTASDGEPLKFNKVQKATHLYNLGMYNESITKWEEIVQKLNSNKSNDEKAKRLMDHIEIALMSYAKADKTKAVFDFLEDCEEKLPNYMLEINYYIARFAFKYNTMVSRGKTALAYCQKNYHDNAYFSQKDLSEIKF